MWTLREVIIMQNCQDLAFKWCPRKSELVCICFSKWGIYVNSSSPHLSLNLGGRWGHNRWLHNVSSIFLFSTAPGTWQTPGLFIPWCRRPTSFLSALTSFPFHNALQDSFGPTWWTVYMSIPQDGFVHTNSVCVSLPYQEVSVWSDCRFLYYAYYLALAPNFHGSYSSSQLLICAKVL